MLPVRCFSCGRVLAPSVPVTRWCCKRMMLGFIDFTEDMLLYSVYDNDTPDAQNTETPLIPSRITDIDVKTKVDDDDDIIPIVDDIDEDDEIDLDDDE